MQLFPNPCWVPIIALGKSEMMYIPDNKFVNTGERAYIIFRIIIYAATITQSATPVCNSFLRRLKYTVIEGLSDF